MRITQTGMGITEKEGKLADFLGHYFNDVHGVVLAGTVEEELILKIGKAVRESYKCEEN